MSETEAKIMMALGSGARTFQISKALGWPTVRANRALRQMEAEGRVCRDQQRSAVNDIRWIPAAPAQGEGK